MLFNSLAYLLFLPTVFILYWFVVKKSLLQQNLLILVASYIFYGWWSWKFLILLALSTLLDFAYGFGVASSSKNKSRLFLWLSIINNLGILAIFKYFNFFTTEAANFLGLFGLRFHPALLSVALPVGISFYTFHGMSYVFDIYKRKREPVANFIDYAVFVCFFPLLVAGPIERANHLLPQVQKKREFNYQQAVEGCRLILWGLFKKIVIADSLSFMVDDIFDNYQHYHASSLVLACIGFSIQIYGDFSGYSDIAMGSAKLLGFELLSNFRFPYFSRDIAEFWRRWHISLSSWFRDYLYIPLGGSKIGKIMALRNTFVIFLTSGLWHGASMNFIIWGGVHAMGFMPLLLANRNRKHINEIVAHNRRFPTVKEIRQIFFTFTFVTFAWIFFRIHDLETAVLFIKKIFVDSFAYPSQFLHLPNGISILLYVALLILTDWNFRRNERAINFSSNKWIRQIAYYTITFTVIYFAMNQVKQQFIYFKF